MLLPTLHEVGGALALIPTVVACCLGTSCTWPMTRSWGPDVDFGLRTSDQVAIPLLMTDMLLSVDEVYMIGEPPMYAPCHICE